MATRVLLRTLLSSANRALTPRSFTASAYLQRLRPIVTIAAANLRQSSLPATSARAFSTRHTTSSLNDSDTQEETFCIEGCDFEHWLVVVEKPEGDPLRDEIIDWYINILAQVVGSYDEARMKIYSVSTRCYYAFGALVPEEVADKIREVPGVRFVLPDSYLDPENKAYGGEPFINGKAVPYDPKYHEEWIRNSEIIEKRNGRREEEKNMQNYRGPPNMGFDLNFFLKDE